MSPITSKTSYEILGISENTPFDEITSAYRRLATLHHPDKFLGTPEYEESQRRMIEINSAYTEIGKILKAIENKANAEKEELAGLEEEVTKKSNDFWAYFNLAKAYSKYEKWSLAVEHYKKAISINSLYGDAYIKLGEAFEKLDKPNDALEIYKNGVIVDSNNRNIFYALAILLEKLDGWDKALFFYKFLDEQKPNNINIIYYLAETYRHISRWSEAAETYTKIINMPNNSYSLAYYWQGICYFRLKKFQEAIMAFNESLKIQPNDHFSYYHIAKCYIKLSQWQQAIIACNKAIEIKSDFPNAYLTLGEIYKESERYNQAVIAYEKAFQLDEKLTEAYMGLSYIYTYKLRDHDKAIEYLKKAIISSPDYMDAHFELGFCYHLTRQQHLAFEEYKIIQYRSPNLAKELIKYIYK